MLKREYSEKLWQEALRYLPGGVNSPVRAFRGVGGTPFFTKRAKGSRLWDVDGNEYVDYVGSWGPMILGHAHPKVIRAVQEAAQDGTSFGTPNPREIRLAQLVSEASRRFRSSALLTPVRKRPCRPFVWRAALRNATRL